MYRSDHPVQTAFLSAALHAVPQPPFPKPTITAPPRNEPNLALRGLLYLSLPEIKMAASPAGFITLGHVTAHRGERAHLVRDKWRHLEVWCLFK